MNEQSNVKFGTLHLPWPKLFLDLDKIRHLLRETFISNCQKNGQGVLLTEQKAC